MKFGICNEIFKDWKIEDTFAYAAKAGYDAVEIAPFTIAKYVTEISAAERVRIKEAAARAKIAISGIHWVLVQAEGMYLTHPEAAIREKTAKYFCDLVDFCADLGGKTIVVGSPKQRNIMEGVTKQQAWEWATAVFADSVKCAQERNIIICFEPLAPSETNFINTAEEAIQFVKQHNSPHFQIIIDVKAMSSETKPIPQIIKESWPHFAYFHANDKNLKGPGFGEIDFKPIFAALKEVGYKGYVSVEVFNFDEGPEVIATQSIEYMKKVRTAVGADPVIYPRSPREVMAGWTYLPRFVDKIRLHLAGKLHPDYQENFTKGFDAAWLRAAGVTGEQMIEAVRNTTTDGEVCDWVNRNIKKTDAEKATHRDGVLNFGKQDDEALRARLKMRKEQSGLSHRDDIQTFVDYIDADEKRI